MTTVYHLATGRMLTMDTDDPTEAVRWAYVHDSGRSKPAPIVEGRYTVACGDYAAMKGDAKSIVEGVGDE